MKLIVGLGNPGEKYGNTRHNLGFMAVEKFMQDFEIVEKTAWKNDEKLKSKTVQLDWQPKHGQMERVILALPQTYMNNSGMAVSLIASYYKIDPGDIWVVYDELDLPMGAMRIRFGGAAAGHKGVESVIEKLGTDAFWRFRLGIGYERPHSGRARREEDAAIDPKISRQFLGNVEDYVLSTFSQEDHNKVREVIKHASDAMQNALEKGLEAAMNRYNTK
jgi:PTH1 family peptidyl-tRNA hydrolase